MNIKFGIDHCYQCIIFELMPSIVKVGFEGERNKRGFYAVLG